MSSSIDSLVAEFVVNLRKAIAAEAAAAFAVVAGGGGQPDPLLRAKKRPGPKPKGSPAAAPKAVAGGKRGRRSPEDIAKQAAAILAFVKKNPGSKAEKIGADVGLSSLEMQIPIAQLLSEKKLGKKGERRATVYTAK